MKPGEMLAYPTVRQLKDFQLKRQSGDESWFRAKLCDVCKTEVPNVYECCSVSCHEAKAKNGP